MTPSPNRPAESSPPKKWQTAPERKLTFAERKRLRVTRSFREHRQRQMLREDFIRSIANG